MELLGPDGAGERLILRDLQGQVDPGNPHKLAVAVREYLDMDPSDPEGLSNHNHAFEDFRSRVEDAGVWVFKRSFRQKDVAGLCLCDEAYPVIYLNHGAAKERQVFTLFNGLAHLLFDFSYIERKDKEYYVKALPVGEQTIENACRMFGEEFGSHAAKYPSETRSTTRLPRRGQTAHHQRGYYDLQKAFLGQKYIRTVFQSFEEGRIEDLDVASYLGVRGRYLDELEKYACQS